MLHCSSRLNEIELFLMGSLKWVYGATIENMNNNDRIYQRWRCDWRMHHEVIDWVLSGHIFVPPIDGTADEILNHSR